MRKVMTEDKIENYFTTAEGYFELFKHQLSDTNPEVRKKALEEHLARLSMLAIFAEELNSSL